MVAGIPMISVIMPVYNSEQFVAEAISSILNQSFPDFELIIIDDASTDNSVSIVLSYNDPRIKLVRKPVNTGLTISLNMGISMASGRYIARMDSDDVADLYRFKKQVAFMESNPSITVCGTWFKYLDSDTVIQHPNTHNEIKVRLLSGCVIGHPTVFMRTSFLREHNLFYNPEKEPAEDYDLWARIALKGELANINEVLLYYRIHGQQVSVSQNEKQAQMSQQVMISLLSSLEPNLNENDVSVLKVNEKYLNPCHELFRRIDFLTHLQCINKKIGIFEEVYFNCFISERKKRIIFSFINNSVAYNWHQLSCFLTRSRMLVKYVGSVFFLRYCVKAALGYQSVVK